MCVERMNVNKCVAERITEKNDVVIKKSKRTCVLQQATGLEKENRYLRQPTQPHDLCRKAGHKRELKKFETYFHLNTRGIKKLKIK